VRRGLSLFGSGTLNPNSGGSFATLTHARLRAAQGDVAGAVRILRVILTVQPDHDEARELLTSLENRVGVAHREPQGTGDAPARPATSEDLADRFRNALGAGPAHPRVERLSRWLERADRNRGPRHVR